MTEGTIKIGTDQIVEIGEFNLTAKVEIDQGMNKTYRRENFRGNSRSYQNFGRQNSRGE